jgi:hypothetical protein
MTTTTPKHFKIQSQPQLLPKYTTAQEFLHHKSTSNSHIKQTLKYQISSKHILLALKHQALGSKTLKLPTQAYQVP